MANNVQTAIRVTVCLAGLGILTMGVLLLASGIMIANLLKDIGLFSGFETSCQYWAGIPIIVTGIMLLPTACVTRYRILKYASTCCVLTTMVLSLIVIVEESSESATVRSMIDGMICKDIDELDIFNMVEKCDTLRSAHSWYNIMLFTSAIAIVLCITVLFALFADWILFVAMKSSYREYLESMDSHAHPHTDYTRFCAPDGLEQPIWNARYEGGGMPLGPV
ncbi:uncharacterized protein LOC114521719 [Dendronephthya gigantea]|uniref:uncharacterized protein LOC114521719 n=1 Tax=Dendronephthya gigantea TaxID=151771 RepID=UPI001069F9BB|nr:uncharacterized protein LOC114521719 [Dendronephthya gigantea]